MRASFTNILTKFLSNLPMGGILLFLTAWILHSHTESPFWITDFLIAFACYAILSISSWFVQIRTAHDMATQKIIKMVFGILVVIIVSWYLIPQSITLKTILGIEAVLYVLSRHFFFPFSSTSGWRAFNHLKKMG